MKKTLAILLALLLAVTFISCEPDATDNLPAAQNFFKGKVLATNSIPVGNSPTMNIAFSDDGNSANVRIESTRLFYTFTTDNITMENNTLIIDSRDKTGPRNPTEEPQILIKVTGTTNPKASLSWIDGNTTLDDISLTLIDPADYRNATITFNISSDIRDFLEKPKSITAPRKASEPETPDVVHRGFLQIKLDDNARISHIYSNLIEDSTEHLEILFYSDGCKTVNIHSFDATGKAFVLGSLSMDPINGFYTIYLYRKGNNQPIRFNGIEAKTEASTKFDELKNSIFYIELYDLHDDYRPANIYFDTDGLCEKIVFKDTDFTDISQRIVGDYFYIEGKTGKDTFNAVVQATEMLDMDFTLTTETSTLTGTADNDYRLNFSNWAGVQGNYVLAVSGTDTVTFDTEGKIAPEGEFSVRDNLEITPARQVIEETDYYSTVDQINKDVLYIRTLTYSETYESSNFYIKENMADKAKDTIADFNYEIEDSPTFRHPTINITAGVPTLSEPGIEAGITIEHVYIDNTCYIAVLKGNLLEVEGFLLITKDNQGQYQVIEKTIKSALQSV